MKRRTRAFTLVELLGRKTSEAMVVAPADMIAIGDSAGGDALIPYNEVYTLWTRHKRSHNTVFCDGHVEGMKMGERKKKTEAARKRWNIDNEPHPETWMD
jgi:prepilin-type processing-associated H-X9-DG protein